LQIAYNELLLIRDLFSDERLSWLGKLGRPMKNYNTLDISKIGNLMMGIKDKKGRSIGKFATGLKTRGMGNLKKLGKEKKPSNQRRNYKNNIETR